MTALFNTISNYDFLPGLAGNSIMSGGSKVQLAVGEYKCSEGKCAIYLHYVMLHSHGLFGDIKCKEETASCVINGEDSKRLLDIRGTGGETLTLRAVHFVNGKFDFTGGVFIDSGAVVDIELCIFSNCKATPQVDSANKGGGAIYVWDAATVQIYGTQFVNNTAEGFEDEIYNSQTKPGEINVHNVCPTPYFLTEPIQGKKTTNCANIRIVTVFLTKPPTISEHRTSYRCRRHSFRVSPFLFWLCSYSLSSYHQSCC
jgi:hypothetical protein